MTKKDDVLERIDTVKRCSKCFTALGYRYARGLSNTCGDCSDSFDAIERREALAEFERLDPNMVMCSFCGDIHHIENTQPIYNSKSKKQYVQACWSCFEYVESL